MSKIRSLALVTTLAGAACIASAVPATAATPAAVSCSYVGTTLNVGAVLKANQCIRSTNGAFTLVMQSDGNLVSYRISNGQVCWAANLYHPNTGTVARVYGKRDGAPIDFSVEGTWGSVEYLGSGTGALNVSESNRGQMYVGYAPSYTNC